MRIKHTPLVVMMAVLFARETPAQAVAQMPALHGEGVVVDAARQRLVLLGGGTPEGWLKGTWAWNNGWSQIIDSASTPPLRSGHAIGYDSDARRVFIFGGNFGPPRTNRCDTWILNGTAWNRAADTCITERVVNAALVYDSRRRQMLLLEGAAVGRDTARAMRMWRWERDAWTTIDSAGPRRVGFSAVAFDEARSVLVVPVLFGGPDAGVWEWNGERWRHIAATQPGTRQTYGLTYDPTRRRVVLAGGQRSTRGPYLNDVWTWEGDRWAEVALDSASAPPPRGGGWLLADRSGRLLLFGGYNETPLNDLWSLEERLWRAIAR